jgi:hypothetical protein
MDGGDQDRASGHGRFSRLFIAAGQGEYRKR